MTRTDLATALSTLTRLPTAWLWPTNPVINAPRAIWAYPIAGALIGAIAAACFAVLHKAGCSTAIAAFWTLAAMLLTTGALHEDGLADTADGFGGGRTRERKLEIMRDSRIGSYGACALVLSLALRGIAIAELDGNVAALIAACALSRASAGLLLALLPPARPEGLSAAVAAPPRIAVVVSLAIGIGFTLAFLPITKALAAITLALLTAAAMARLSRRHIGGHTGDVLGATIVIAECAILTECSLRFG